MKHLRLWAALCGLFYCSVAFAQTPGFVTNHAFILGKGAGTQGYTSLLCASAQLAVGQSAADPICQTITGDVTLTAGGVTAIGAGKVTKAMLSPGAAAGDILYWNGTAWVILTGNNSGTKVLQETSSGVPSWATVAGTGTVTSAQISAGNGIAVATTSGANPCVTICNLTVSLTTARQTLPTHQSFTTATSSTYTTPANVLYIRVRMVGGGGGGGGSGTSGGSAGSGGTASLFGTSLFTANGGSGGGSGSSTASGGAGGTASGCTINLTGSSGASTTGVSGAFGPGGAGGNSAFFAGGGFNSNATGLSGIPNTGGGASGGAISGTNPGGAGGGGGGSCEGWITSPAGSYSYTVGAGGALGALGSSGNNGGAGGSGSIYVDEYYN